MTKDDAPIAHRIVLVHSESCHFCTDAGEFLDELQRAHGFDFRSVRADSDEGRELVARHRPAMSPLVLVDGEFFSHGRLPRKKLERVLGARAVIAAEANRGN